LKIPRGAVRGGTLEEPAAVNPHGGVCLRFMLTTDGDKLEFLDLKERPFKRAIDTGGPPFLIFLPDKSVSPACNKIEFFH
jgi:hypothetical protein